MNIVWTDRAILDLRDAASRRTIPGADVRLLRSIVETIERLRDFPLSGRVVPELDDEAFREVIARDYRVIYWIAGDVVEILAVVHGKRLLTWDLLREAEGIYVVARSRPVPAEVPVGAGSC